MNWDHNTHVDWTINQTHNCCELLEVKWEKILVTELLDMNRKVEQ